ncbi:TRAP transporter large permease subunit [Marinobacterium aestuariivivens]|uniref:TRAP transporter large permease subunit n=1 Tax=Marinobacterium aestuariivivens TaxID=1698799 RepID=A0ABW2A9J6_9GAMM
MVGVVAACAAAGLVIGGISMTGLGGKFADLVFLLSGNDTVLVLLISAVLAIILGMGMPTPSAFILAAVLVGPTLSALDFSAMQTNMFILYFAVLSAMTPPWPWPPLQRPPLPMRNPGYRYRRGTPGHHRVHRALCLHVW